MSKTKVPVNYTFIFAKLKKLKQSKSGVPS